MRKQRRKILFIILIVVAVVTSAITFGVVVFMNSPKMKLASIIPKISKIEKGDGTYSIDAHVHIAEGDVEVGLQNGTIILTRKIEEKHTDVNNFLQVKGTVYAKANADSKLRLGAKYINEEKGEWLLTNQYALKSSFLNQQTTYQLNDTMKSTLSRIFIVSKSSGGNQEESLQSFLLQGYEPPINGEQNKAVITITKSEITKALHRMEENIRADRQKFITLLKKQNAQILEQDAEKFTQKIVDGEVFKDIEKNVFSKISDFHFKIMFEEKSADTINISTELKYNGTIAPITKEGNINLVVKTSIDYKVLT